MANAGVIARTAEHGPTGSPRLIVLLLDGLAAGAVSPAVAPPSARQMLQAMREPR